MKQVVVRQQSFLINKTSVLSLLLPDYGRIQEKLSLCKPPSSPEDIYQLNGLLRNAFTLMAMLDYPYSTHFMGNMPAHPVKVRRQSSQADRRDHRGQLDVWGTTNKLKYGHSNAEMARIVIKPPLDFLKSGVYNSNCQ